MSELSQPRVATSRPVDMQLNRNFGPPPLFNPEQGTTVVEPPGTGSGWWAGAPSALWDGRRYYLSYRLRRPQPDRGGETRVAVSDDGVHFETIWVGRKEEFDSPSIERCALVQVDAELWRLYVSYVDGADGKWRIDLLEAPTPDAFSPASRIPIFTAADIGAEGVKDPWVCQLGGEWVMIASYAPTPVQPPSDPSKLHATRDVYNTGLTKSMTGLATSLDGQRWTWEGSILVPPDDGWDAYATRLNTIVLSPPLWIGFYDGSSSVAQNYEERCGVAYSQDLRHWRRSSQQGPMVGAAGGPGTVRYVEAVQSQSWIRYYYEYTRTDGSHELRTSLVEA